MSNHGKHLTDEQLIACYFAEAGDDAALTGRRHTALCVPCAERYAELTHDLDVIAGSAASEADRAFSPDVLAHQRHQIMRRLEAHGRRADVFLFPIQRRGATSTRTALKRPARWVAAAAAAGLTVGLGLGFTVDRLRVNRFQDLPRQLASRGDVGARGPQWQASPRLEGTQAERLLNQIVGGDDPNPNPNNDELLEEIDSALISRRVQELSALDALTPENVSISVRRR